MSIPYTTGTVTLTQGQTEVAGNGTAWQTALIRGGVLYVAGFSLPIQTVISNTSLVASIEWPGTTGEFDYAIVRDTDDARQQSANATILSQLLAELQAGTLFKYDVAGKLAELSTYDERLKDFAFLAVDQNPAQLFIKLSNASGDWSDPKRYAQGEAGPAPTIQFAPTITGAPGTPASATIDGDGTIDDPYVITFTLPAGMRGVTWRGAYTGATAYHAYDLVRDNRSIWIALQDTTGHAPPVLPTTINAWWELVSPAGQDGTGIGDVVGPSEVVDGSAAMFDGTTGKLIKAGTPSQFAAWLGTVNGRNDALFALEIADLKGQRLGMNGGVSDAFDDQTGIVPPSGGIDANTVSVLHFDGTNGSLAIVDSAPVPKVWIFDSSNAASISTVQSIFGGSSAVFNGGAAGASTPFPPDFVVGTGDFTVDMRVRPGVATPTTLFDCRSAANQNNPVLYTDTSNRLAYNSGNAVRITGTTVLAIGVWYHLAVSRVSGVTRIFVNGVQEGISYSDPVDVQATPYLFVGYNYLGASSLTGYIDELRLSRAGLYAANFAPPTAAYFFDVSGSFNFVYDAANDWFNPSPLNGGTDPSAFIDRTLGTPIGSMTAVGGLAAAFDGNTSQSSAATARSPTTADASAYMGKDFGGTPQRIGSVTTYGATDCGFDGTTAATSVTITLRAKNSAPANRSDGIALGSVTIADAAAQPRTILSNDTNTAYRYVWVDIVSSSGSGIYIGEVQFYAPAWSNMTLVSVAFTATTVPSQARVALQLAGINPFTPSTDFSVEVTRDNGTTWTAVTLTATMSFNGIKIYEGVADVSGQPSGSTMRWRAKTLTNKNVIMSGVVEQWS